MSANSQAKLASSSSRDVEQGAEEPQKSQSSSRRLLNWVSKDVFDWNPAYVKTARGILHLLHILLSALVMALEGSGCAHHTDKGQSYFKCHSSAAFLFVVASAAMIQSTLLLVCRLLSKRGLAIVHATANELLYYVVFFLFFLISGLSVESNLDPEESGHNSIMAGGVFGITNAILFLISAIWFFTFFCSKTRRLVTSEKDMTNDNDGTATSEQIVVNDRDKSKDGVKTGGSGAKKGGSGVTTGVSGV